MRQLGRWLLVVAVVATVREGTEGCPGTVAAAGDGDPVDDTTPLEAETHRNFARFAFNFYSQSDGGGNPNLKEDMTVFEPQLLVGLGLTDDLSLSLKAQGDIISAASVDHRYRFPNGAQSGASGDTYFGLEGGLFYAWSDQVHVGVGLSGSVEYDYASFGANTRLVWDSEDKNDTLLVKLSAFFDTLTLILFDGTQPGLAGRRSYNVGVGWTHLLGPRTVGTLNYDLTLQNGFLSTPYNSVFTTGGEARELLPHDRLRHAVFARVRQLVFDDLALEPGVGVYLDDWGARALNAELHAYWEVFPGVVLLQPWYRYHTQSQIDWFVADTASVLPDLRTQDSDLAAFDSHTFGLKLVVPHVDVFNLDTELNLGGDFTLRSDDLNAFSLGLGLMVRY